LKETLLEKIYSEAKVKIKDDVVKNTNIQVTAGYVSESCLEE
jgi:hypothetical protein